ncbi:Uncharacterised protein [uncultured archaeon]|nr:Uncharacterised protein [uncultured archaeon]
MLNTNKFILGILAVLLAFSFASAMNVSTTSLALTVNNGSSSSTSFTITNNETDLISISIGTITGLGTLTTSVSNSSFNLSAGENKTITVNITAPSAQTNNTFYGNLPITSNGSNPSLNLNLTVNAIQVLPTPVITSSNFCKSGNQGNNLSITDFSINNKGEGDDNDWYLMDQVNIDVEVTNNMDKRANNVEAEIGIFSGGEDVTSDFSFEDKRISLGSIGSDNSKTATFTIKSLPVDLNEGSYTIRVKTYISGNENTVCDSTSDSTDVTNPFGEGVIVANEVVGTTVEASAGNVLDQISMDAVNLGSSKEEEVLVNIYNKELGINQNYHLSNLRAGSSELIYFPAIDIPATAISKTYKVDVTTYYNYNDGDTTEADSYDQNSYDDLEDNYNTFSFNIKVINGQTPVDPSRPTLTAKLDNDAVVGKPMNITLSLKNNGAASMATLVSVQDYDSWSTLDSLTPSTLLIAKGDTKTVVLTLVPTKDGQQTFKINVLYDGKTISQDVAVNVAKKTGFLSSVFGEANSTSYLITGIVILVALIVVVLVVKLIKSRKE